MTKRVGIAVLVALLLTGCSSTDPDQSDVLWTGTYDSGYLSDFAQIGQNDAGPIRPEVESSIVADGQFAGAYRIPPRGTRSETIAGDVRLRKISEGDDLWFGWRIRIPAGLPTRIPQYQKLVEWQNPSFGDPPLSLTVGQSADVFRAEGGFDNPNGNRHSSVDLGPVAFDRWITWLWHIKFSTNPDIGTVTIWRDGDQLINDWHPTGGTLYPQFAADGSNPNNADGVYVSWKQGYSRDPSILTDNTVYFDSLRAATSRAGAELPPLKQGAQ
ncbi:heparin lyase I family protein [Antrihabitans cavernicola]|uniref:Polysaccharide lyase n=1 Tax=Antrihabitans cavernicola TaxID=2495913 RepID=A0A5A7SCI0_9NOCA|nr:heparin lyase I family protein [Spelaeibacter cavernicola]KAA0023860.1 hypothetical protein FOY51_04520 [Spelaeibacter cavernicola]